MMWWRKVGSDPGPTVAQDPGELVRKWYDANVGVRRLRDWGITRSNTIYKHKIEVYINLAIYPVFTLCWVGGIRDPFPKFGAVGRNDHRTFCAKSSDDSASELTGLDVGRELSVSVTLRKDSTLVPSGIAPTLLGTVARSLPSFPLDEQRELLPMDERKRPGQVAS